MRDIDSELKAQLAAITEPAVLGAFARLQVRPYISARPWDYGDPDEKLSCWIVAESQKENLVVAYCDRGFGPGHPWGVMRQRGDDFQMSMGMDSDWFDTLSDVFTKSWASKHLLSEEKEPNQPLQRNASTGSASSFKSPARRG